MNTDRGNKSDGDRLVNTKAKTNSATSHRLRRHGTPTYQMATPINAMIYPLDSLPVLNNTTNNITDAKNINRNAGCPYCPLRR